MESVYWLSQHPLFHLALILVSAFLLDLLIGDPPSRFHPIRILGYMIQATEAFLRRRNLHSRLGGLLLVFAVEVPAIYTTALALNIAGSVHAFLEVFVAVFICLFSISLKDLVGHVQAVLVCLERRDMEGAKERVAMVVGRDVTRLDKSGITRAAIETLAENFVDGFFAPIFWFFVGGVWGYFLGSDPVATATCFVVAFKVASTLDSMVGYKNEQYRELGLASARLDDFLNYLPSRISIFPFVLGAMLCRKDVLRGLKVFFRDRTKHDSPNAAHAESFVSGAIGVRLGGPTRYEYGIKEKPWLGEEFPDPAPVQISEAICLIKAGAWVGTSGLLAALLFVGMLK